MPVIHFNFELTCLSIGLDNNLDWRLNLQLDSNQTSCWESHFDGKYHTLKTYTGTHIHTTTLKGILPMQYIASHKIQLKFRQKLALIKALTDKYAVSPRKNDNCP